MLMHSKLSATSLLVFCGFGHLKDERVTIFSDTRAEWQIALQFCYYLFYFGKIRTIRLEYTDAKESLLEAARKAPTTARGFRIQCNKWAIIVRLLLVGIPQRTVFMQKGMKKALTRYFELTNVSNWSCINSGTIGEIL